MSHDNRTLIIDLEHGGKRRYIAACLLVAGNEAALLDPGPSSTIETLRSGLREQGLQIKDIRTVLLTHIHLDHAGCVGHLVAENPRLRVLVHARGARHVVDPTRLVQSAAAVWGNDHWGVMLPAPAANVTSLAGGETLCVGDRSLEVLYTPGHAVHHISFFENETSTAYVGDAAGLRIADAYVYPATPPPDVQLEDLDDSLEIIASKRPRRFLLTHFGFADKVDWHVAEFRARLYRWSNFVRQSLDRPLNDTRRIAEFVAMVKADMVSVLGPEEGTWLQTLISPVSNWHGLAQYWRRRHGETGASRN